MLTKVFFSYSPKDGAMRDELVAHLEILRVNGKISMWSEQNIQAGDAWREVARREIEAADLVLLLVSADFLASEYCRDTEVRRAWARHEAGKARVVPIVLRPCLWEEATFGKLQPLPANRRPVTRWEDRDEAWVDVAQSIRLLAEERETASKEAQGAATSGQDKVTTSSASAGDVTSTPLRPDLERWLLDLEAAHAEKQSAPADEKDRARIQAKIDDLKRKLREGGQLQQGDSLGDGRYYLLHQIGRGGFATVWEAEDRDVGKRVAIKVLHPHLAADPTRRERFFRGARAMEKTLHPSVVRVLVPYEEDAGFSYFVMELIEGTDLHRAVLSKRLPRDRVVRLTLQAGEALAAAHRKGFVHRDVSPHNILIDANGDAKLTDFDLVSAAESTGGTRTGAMGKFLYAAPEVSSRPQDADARADVYGLAMTAVFCLYGAELPVQVIRKTEEFVAALECGPLAPVLLRALEAEPSDRYASMRMFCDALRAASESKVLSYHPSPKARAAVGEVGTVVSLAPAYGPIQEEPSADLPVGDASSGEPLAFSAPIEAIASAASPRIVTWSPSSAVPRPVVQQASLQRGDSGLQEKPLPDAAASASLSEQARFPRQDTPAGEDGVVPEGPGTSSPFFYVGQPLMKPKPPAAPSRLTRRLVIAALVFFAVLILVSWGVMGFLYWTGRLFGSAEPTASASSASTSAALPRSASSSAEPSSSASRCPPDMAFIGAGKFRMGAEKDDTGANRDERTVHEVTLTKPFCLDVAEVTVAKYRACTKEARNGVKCAPAPTTVQWAGADVKLWSQFCNGDRSDRDDHPVNCVDWNMADTYCRWTGGVLPTGAQWEYAARGEEGRKYAWGNEPVPGPEMLNACGSECRALGKLNNQTWPVMYEGNDGAGATAPVKSYSKGKTPEGVFDLAGNVWEWVADMNAQDDAPSSTNPLQTQGTTRALRGDGWGVNVPRGVYAAFRYGDVGIRLHDAGFRCKREPIP